MMRKFENWLFYGSPDWVPFALAIPIVLIGTMLTIWLCSWIGYLMGELLPMPPK